MVNKGKICLPKLVLLAVWGFYGKAFNIGTQTFPANRPVNWNWVSENL